MDRYTIHMAAYWRGVQCIFVKSRTKLYLARVYDEGHDLHDVVEAGPNCFVIADDLGIELWCLSEAQSYLWHRPPDETLSDAFIWKSGWAVSDSGRFVAVSGGPRFRPSSVYLLDTKKRHMREFRNLMGCEHHACVRSVSDTAEIIVSAGRGIAACQITIDGRKGVFQPSQLADAAYLRPKPDWEAPASDDASRMKVEPPINMTERSLSHETIVLCDA